MESVCLSVCEHDGCDEGMRRCDQFMCDSVDYLPRCTLNNVLHNLITSYKNEMM